MDLISVIIPVYNVEKYLRRSLDSIIKQTYNKLEIILIDDGSTDKSALICDKYNKKDKRIKVIHKNNEGVSIARNKGLEIATGKYVCFVDSDDFLPKNAIEGLYNAIEKSNADLSVGCLAYIMPKRTTYEKCNERLVNKFSFNEYAKVLDLPKMKGPVAKLFHNEIIKTHALKFPENILVCEDTLFVYEYLKHCKTIYELGSTVYYYNKLSLGSATTRFYNKFHEIMFLCTQKYLENVIIDDKITDARIQKKIISDFIAIKEYIGYFAQDKDLACEMLKQAFDWYKPYIYVDKLKGEDKIFSTILRDFDMFNKGDFNVTLLAKKSTFSVKRILLKILINIKRYFIFTLKLGYRN